MSRLRSVASASALLLALVGCSAGATPVTSSQGSTTSSQATTSSSQSTSTSTQPAPAGQGGCASFDGQTGVVRVFCDGPAKATLTINGKTSQLTGGSCEDSSMGFAVNFGVVTTSDFTGAKPDYLGVVLIDKMGTIAATSGGKRYAATDEKMTVRADKLKVHTEGANQTSGGGTIVADITCR